MCASAEGGVLHGPTLEQLDDEAFLICIQYCMNSSLFLVRLRSFPRILKSRDLINHRIVKYHDFKIA